MGGQPRPRRAWFTSLSMFPAPTVRPSRVASTRPPWPTQAAQATLQGLSARASRSYQTRRMTDHGYNEPLFEVGSRVTVHRRDGTVFGATVVGHPEAGFEASVFVDDGASIVRNAPIVASLLCSQSRPHCEQVLVPLRDVAAESPSSPSASVVDESTSAGGAGQSAAGEAPEDESMQISPAGSAGHNEAPPEALVNAAAEALVNAAAAAAGLSTPSSNSLEGEVNLPSPLCLDRTESPAGPQVDAIDGPLPETEAKPRGLKRTGGAGASEPWSPDVAGGWAEDSRLREDDHHDDQAGSGGTAGSKRRCGPSQPAQPAQPGSGSFESKRARMYFRPIRNEDGSDSSSSS